MAIGSDYKYIRSFWERSLVATSVFFRKRFQRLAHRRFIPDINPGLSVCLDELGAPQFGGGGMASTTTGLL